MSKKTVSDYPELMKEWHPTKNGDLNPNVLCRGSDKKIWWKCSVEDDHEWEATIYNRTTRKDGCACCSGHKAVLSNCLTKTHPELSKQWHPTKNGNLTSNMVKAGSNKKVWWKCPIANDHEWESKISDRKQGRNCPCCSNPIRKIVLSNCLATTHPELIKQWHPTKNGDLTPYDVVAGSHKKVWWKCQKCQNTDKHEWKAIIADVSFGTSCPICKESKGEKAVAKTLTNFSLKFKRQWKFKSCKNVNSLPFDFVVKTKNGIKIIEYQGEQHFFPIKFFGGNENFIKLKKRDLIKQNWCKKKKIPLLAINYLDFENIEQLVQAYINT